MLHQKVQAYQRRNMGDFILIPRRFRLEKKQSHTIWSADILIFKDSDQVQDPSKDQKFPILELYKRFILDLADMKIF